MSRVGKNEIIVPPAVSFEHNKNEVTFKGKLCSQSYALPECVVLEKTTLGIKLTPADQTMRARALWGTAQRNISNIVKGLNDGFTINLELVGVGYRASVSGNKVILQLGFSHDVEYPLPEGVTAKCDKPTVLTLSGPNKQVLGQIAAEIRKYRKPEPYKGKGVIREKEYVVRKEGKKK
jgi:large subunit ribosomal protein L6